MVLNMKYLKQYWREALIGILLLSSLVQWVLFFAYPRFTQEQYKVLAEDDVWLRTQIIPLLQQNLNNGVLDPSGFDPFSKE